MSKSHGKKEHKPRTPAEDSAGRKRTADRHDANRAANEVQRKANKELNLSTALVSPEPRRTYTNVNGTSVKAEPFTNRGNGSPSRPSQLKRAAERNSPVGLVPVSSVAYDTSKDRS